METLLCLAASFVVNPRQFGGANLHRVPPPVPELARLFSRSPSSVLEKMRNLDGSRPHGAKWDVGDGVAEVPLDPRQGRVPDRATTHEVATALAALTGETHPLATQERW